jgi:exopolysaccharide biosynthesis polyprenyl glycosylphosphotransferase
VGFRLNDGGNGHPHAGNGRDVTDDSRRPQRLPSLFLRGSGICTGRMLTDQVLILGSGVVVGAFFAARRWPTDATSTLFATSGEFIPRFVIALVIFSILTLAGCGIQGLYRVFRTQTRRQERFVLARAVGLTTLTCAGFLCLFPLLPWTALALTGVVSLLSLSGCWEWRGKHQQALVAAGHSRNAVIIGAGEAGQKLARFLGANSHLGYRVKGFLDENHHADPRLLGKPEDLPEVTRRHFIDDVLCTDPLDGELAERLIQRAREQRTNVRLIHEFFNGTIPGNAEAGPHRFLVVDLHRESPREVELYLKRALDVVLSAAALLATAPLMLLVALAVRFDSSGPAFYNACRIGKKGRKFVCYKFRTMVVNADELKDRLRHMNEREGPFFKITDDPRVTRIGGFLRRYSLDELPQLLNVFKGDMSLVGPRPHPLDDYEKYESEHLRRLNVKPGLTGLWQVSARRHPSFQTGLALDIEYIENWSLWLDLKILLLTIPAVLQGEGQ